MLLLIDTSGETASVILSADGVIVASAENAVSREHSSWLHPAVSQLLSVAGLLPASLQAVAVMSGPGSYTGLRVGMAAAKGLCFALNVPLITCNNLIAMAASMIALSTSKTALFCPMIDARRQEVFTALYTFDLELVMTQRPMILEKNSFEAELTQNEIIFGGSGAAKWRDICTSTSASYIVQLPVKETFVKLATDRFNQSLWADPIYSEPEYGKEFHTHVEN